MDITPFKDIITSFSNISNLTLAAWDRDEVVFSSPSDGIAAPATETLKDFANQVVCRGALRTTSPKEDFDLIGVPIRDGDSILGALVAYGLKTGSRPSTSASEVEVFLTSLSELMEDNLTVRQESEKMAEELSRSFEDLYLYSSVATQVKTLRFSSDILNELISELLETMRSDLAFAALPDRKEYNTIFTNETLKKNVDDPDSFIERLLETIPPDEKTLAENYFILNDSRNRPFYSKFCPSPYRFLAVRIQHGDSGYGWLGLVSFNMNEIFRRGELRLLISVAEQIAVVLSNTDLYRDLESFVINVVKSLVYAIEAKDQYTSGHSERVHEYSMMIADEISLDDAQKDDLNWAAILHDVGKIGIPGSILNKPTGLDDKEYSIIKGHPQKGHDILVPIDQLKDSLPGILYHHERYDGKGYPEGLKGEEIPLMSRIIAVADTYDAISSSRAYRSARPKSEAFDIILKASGTQLDPDLVKAFEQVYQKDINKVAV